MCKTITMLCGEKAAKRRKELSQIEEFLSICGACCKVDCTHKKAYTKEHKKLLQNYY